ncbi:glycosyl transferase [Permianibacter aggregans]|nr:glycosyl transferase [Permianibacter aggregans]QGX41338.1 glycosyl transferase [Permianibacter aggregans]
MPNVLPLEPVPLLSRVNTLFWRETISELKKFADKSDTVVVIGKPSELALRFLSLGLHSFSLYDCMDNFPAFYTGISKVSMAKRESSLLSFVDAVVSSSTYLNQRFEAFGISSSLVKNAFDARYLVERVGDSDLERPIFGYIGTIGKWFDWEWLFKLTRLFDFARFQLIGPVFGGAPNLPNNVDLLPAVAHEEAMRLVSKFDVGLIPFLDTDLTKAVDPIKYYEYKALGIPIVSSRFGEMKYREAESGTFIFDGKNFLGGKSANEILVYRVEQCELQVFRERNNWNARFDASGIIC